MANEANTFIPKKLKEDIHKVVLIPIRAGLGAVGLQTPADYVGSLMPDGERNAAFEEALRRAAHRLSDALEPSPLKGYLESKNFLNVEGVRHTTSIFLKHRGSPERLVEGLAFDLKTELPAFNEEQLSDAAQVFVALVWQELYAVEEFQGMFTALDTRDISKNTNVSANADLQMVGLLTDLI
ncbi:MAG: hypothetical protein IIC24_12845, partial [Chloroflexi bacterium]|nr:hypothetical protein [Chloroflexota bacterium]